MPGSGKVAFGLAIFLSLAIVGQLIVIYLQQSMSPAAQYALPAPPGLPLERAAPHAGFF